MERIVEFANTVKIEDVAETLQRQIDCNGTLPRRASGG